IPYLKAVFSHVDVILPDLLIVRSSIALLVVPLPKDSVAVIHNVAGAVIDKVAVLVEPGDLQVGVMPKVAWSTTQQTPYPDADHQTSLPLRIAHRRLRRPPLRQGRLHELLLWRIHRKRARLHAPNNVADGVTLHVALRRPRDHSNQPRWID